MSLNRVIRSSLWLYVSGIAANFLGFIYWLVATRFVGASVIGDAAAVIGVVSIVTSIFSLGISSGITRMLGQAQGKGDRASMGVILSSAIALSLALSGLAAVIVAAASALYPMPGFEVPFLVALIFAYGAVPPLQAFYNSTLRTSVIALSSISASTLRVALGVLFLYLGWSFEGVMAAYVVSSVTQNAVMLAYLKGAVGITKPSYAAASESVKVGLPSYIPSLVSTAGSWLGVLGVYGFAGNLEAGTYYVAQVIAYIVYSLPLSLLGLMFPVLSGMEDGRKRATNRATLLTTAIVAPLAAAVIVYPKVPLSLLGEAYADSSLALQILLLAAFFATIPSGFNSLIYAYGKYRNVTLLGFAYNVPRILLYPFLVALWGENGAAVSYVSGFVVATLAVAVMSRGIGYSVGWKQNAAAGAIPLAVALPFYFLPIPWIAGVLVILAASAFFYARLGLIKKSDLAEVSLAFISKSQIQHIQPYARYILDVLYGR